MGQLTIKQERFAQAYVDTGSAAEAYRLAYGSDGEPNTVYVESCGMLKNPKISQRIKDIQDEIEALALWTRVQSMEVLGAIAVAGKREADRVAAVKAINAMQGFDQKKLDITSGGQPVGRIERVIIDNANDSD